MQAMIKYLGEAHRGVAGIVKDIYGQPVADAYVRVSGRNFGAKTTPLGEFWRILMPGSYEIEVWIILNFFSTFFNIFNFSNFLK